MSRPGLRETKQEAARIISVWTFVSLVGLALTLFISGLVVVFTR